MPHLATFAVVATATLALEAVTGSDWWLFWPLAGWAGLLSLHYFLASACDLDRGWVEERAADLRSRSYDFDHIRSIEQRIREHDPSVTPPTERSRDGSSP